MSEYQCYQWKRVGRSLSSKQRKEVSSLSSHISVTADSAEVTYNWGNFKHDPLVVLAQYFDIFLYEANWGTQRVGFRFDLDAVDADQLAGFAVGESLEIKKTEESIFIEVWFEENWIDAFYSYYDQDEGGDRLRLEAFESIYYQIQQGDYRGLFLLWLKGCELSPKDSEKVALPKGMATLEEEHRILVDFVGVNKRLIKLASEQSRPLPEKKEVGESLEIHFSKLPVDKKEDYIRRLTSEDAYTVQSELKRELRKLGNVQAPNYLGDLISYGDLANAAEHEAQQEARRAQEEKERRRKEYLTELGQRENDLLDRVHQLFCLLYTSDAADD